MQDTKRNGKGRSDTAEKKSEPKIEKDYKKKKIDPNNSIAIEAPLQNDVDDLDPKIVPKANTNTCNNKPDKK